MVSEPVAEWAPDLSRYPTSKAKRFGASRLTLASDQLTWTPAGMSWGNASRPFTITVGTNPGQAAEVVWIKGVLAASRGINAAPSVDLLALCSIERPARDRCRTVLAYLPGALFHSHDAEFISEQEADKDTFARISKFADRVGFAFTTYRAMYGQNPNRVFPRAVVGGFAIPILAYALWALFAVPGVTLIADIPKQSGGWRAAGLGFGCVFLIFAIAFWPPVIRIIFRRTHRTSVWTAASPADK